MVILELNLGDYFEMFFNFNFRFKYLKLNFFIFSANLQHCKFCNRYLVPPSNWQLAELESKELLGLCLRRVKPQLTSVRLIDAAFIWTESHSKRVKVKLTVQKEVYTNAVLQQSFVIEYVICGQVNIFIF